MSAIPDLNDQEKLILRCYFKQIITVGGLTERLAKILSKGNIAELKRLATS